MEALLSRFRNLTVLLVAVVAQLLYLGYQVKANRDDRLIRVWAVSAVTPMASIVEVIRHNTIGFMQDYFILLDVREQNRKLKATNDRLQMENIYYRNQLTTAEHAQALIKFERQSPSKTIAARVIGNSTVASAKAVFVDRGSTSGVESGMAVVTPDGIVGKIVAVYPLVSQVLLITDPTFKVGVESQRSHIHGVLACGTGKCVVEQIQNEDKVDPGEWFYTSGEDRIFPKGFPVGSVISSQPGQGMRDVKLNLSGNPEGAEEALIVLQGVHRSIPTAPPVEESFSARSLPPPPREGGTDAPVAAKPQTEADKIVQKYAALGKEQGHNYGGLGSTIPNFNAKAVTGADSHDAAAKATEVKSAQSVPQPPAIPSVLGARSQAQTPASVKAPSLAVPNPGPVLPLGSPRRKSPDQTKTSAPPPAQQ
jgi:rod shape-determining protein MreC